MAGPKRVRKVVEESSPLDMAREYLGQKKYDLAVQRANDYLKSKPNNDSAYRVLAEAYSAQGKFENALQAMTAAISLSEKAPPRQEDHKNYRNEIAEKYFERLESEVEKLVAKRDLIGAAKAVERAQELTPEYTDSFALGVEIYGKIAADGKLTEVEKDGYENKTMTAMSRAVDPTNKLITIRPAARRMRAALEFKDQIAYQKEDGMPGPSVAEFLGLDYHRLAYALGASELPKDKKSLLLTPEKRQLIAQQKLLEMEKKVTDYAGQRQTSVDLTPIQNQLKALEKEIMGAPANDKDKTPEVPSVRALANIAAANVQVTVRSVDEANDKLDVLSVELDDVKFWSFAGKQERERFVKLMELVKSRDDEARCIAIGIDTTIPNVKVKDGTVTPEKQFKMVYVSKNVEYDLEFDISPYYDVLKDARKGGDDFRATRVLAKIVREAEDGIGSELIPIQEPAVQSQQPK